MSQPRVRTEATLQQQCAMTYGLILDCFVDDDTWRLFGYTGHPKAGPLFNILSSAAAIERRTVLKREFFVIAVAAVARWCAETSDFPSRDRFLARLLGFIVKYSEPLGTKCFGFATGRGFLEFLEEGVLEYVRTTGALLPRQMLGRLSSQSSHPIPQAWVIATASVFTLPQSMIKCIPESLTLSGISQNTNDDIELSGDVVLPWAQSILNAAA